MSSNTACCAEQSPYLGNGTTGEQAGEGFGCRGQKTASPDSTLVFSTALCGFMRSKKRQGPEADARRRRSARAELRFAPENGRPLSKEAVAELRASRLPVFYVYKLIDPRDDLPFYVGKGQKQRAWKHEALIRAGDWSGNSRKVQRILDIIESGLSVKVEIVAHYARESAALEQEYFLVDTLPGLTNIAPGGRGFAETPFLVQQRMDIRRKKLAELRQREREEAQGRERVRAQKELYLIGETDAHKAEIDNWINGLQGKQKSILRTSFAKAGAARA